jgi:hypothetical protein
MYTASSPMGKIPIREPNARLAITAEQQKITNIKYKLAYFT